MALLFDANLLIDLLLEEGRSGLKKVFGNYILDLTIYQRGNALWKLSVLQDEISIEDSKEVLSLLEDLPGHVNVLSGAQLNLTSLIAVAAKFETTFYDASYLVAARRKNLTLATGDEKLAKIASEYEVPLESL